MRFGGPTDITTAQSRIVGLGSRDVGHASALGVECVDDTAFRRTHKRRTTAFVFCSASYELRAASMRPRSWSLMLGNPRAVFRLMSFMIFPPRIDLRRQVVDIYERRPRRSSHRTRRR